MVAFRSLTRVLSLLFCLLSAIVLGIITVSFTTTSDKVLPAVSVDNSAWLHHRLSVNGSVTAVHGSTTTGTGVGGMLIQSERTHNRVRRIVNGSTALYINSIDYVQTLEINNVASWNWNDLLSPRLDSPGTDRKDSLNNIQSLIRKTEPVAIVFDLSAAFQIDDNHLLSKYLVNKMKHFFTLLHFLIEENRDINFILITKPSFESAIRLAWSKSFVMTLFSSAMQAGQVQAVVMSIDIEHKDRGSLRVCSDVSSVFMNILSQDDINMKEEIVFCSWKYSSPTKRKSVILSTYFTTGTYSQYGHSFKASCFRFIKRWVQSGSYNTEANLVIFHDDLTEQFQQRIKLFFPNVEFVKTTTYGPGRTPNDGRFYIWYEYLQANSDIDNVLATDIRDVHFLSNPFAVMETIGENYLYLGLDNPFMLFGFTNNGVKSNTLKCHSKETADVTYHLKLRPFYNAGVVGGTRNAVMKFFERMMEYLNHTPSKKNCNMGTYAYVAGKYFWDSSFTGYPFQSAFKIGLPGPQNVAVKHKVFPGNNVNDESLD